MSQLALDHVCDPTSLMQDSFSLSEFILGHPDNDSGHFFIDNIDVKKELDSDIEDQQIQQIVSTLESPTMPTFAPAYNMYSPHVALSPAASYSSSSPVPSPSSQVPGPESFVRFGLRQAISAKRVAHGLPLNTIIEYTHKRRRRDEECSPEEREKRRIRRERNKLAALRCRTRRRERIDALEQETAEIEEQNNNVEKEIKGLREQIEELKTLLRTHDCSSSNKQQNEPLNSGLKVKTERISFSDED